MQNAYPGDPASWATWAAQWGYPFYPMAGGTGEDPPPTYEPHQPRPFSVQELRGISAQTQEQHFGLYRNYVEKVNEARRDLWRNPAHDQANPNYSEHRRQRMGEIWNWNATKNHEMYFSTLSPRPRPLRGALRALIEREFGSVDRFIADFRAAAKSVRGWAMLVYDLDDGHLHILGGDRHDQATWNTVLLMGIDVFEHAYFLDRGRDRGPYIEAFLTNLDWGAVEERARRYGVIE